MASRRGLSSAPHRRPVVRALGDLVAVAFPDFLPGQRWFQSKGRRLASVSLVDAGPFGPDAVGGWLTLVEVAFDVGPREVYAVPLVISAGEAAGARIIGRLRAAGEQTPVADAFDSAAFCLALLNGFERDASVATSKGRVRFTRTGAFPPLLPPAARQSRRIGSEQSNTSVVFDEGLILKAFRKVEPGINPDSEVTAFLTARGSFRNIPLLAGTIEYSGAAGLEATLAMLQHFVPNEGDGWSYVAGHLERFFDFARAHPASGSGEPDRPARLAREFSAGVFLALRRLGGLTAGLHVALAAPGDPAFAPEPITEQDVERWGREVRDHVRLTLDAIRARLDTLPAPVRDAATALLTREDALARRAGDLALLCQEGCAKSRVHGDYHLGQVLRTREDFVIFDFEGEPARPMAERRAKFSPLKDVAGMLRSFDYAVATALRRGPRGVTSPADALEGWGETWVELAADAFLAGYRAEAAGARLRLLPASDLAWRRVLGVWELDKALYEVRYEINNRPAWLAIPIRGLGRVALGSR